MNAKALIIYELIVNSIQKHRFGGVDQWTLNVTLNNKWQHGTTKYATLPRMYEEVNLGEDAIYEEAADHVYSPGIDQQAGKPN